MGLAASIPRSRQVYSFREFVIETMDEDAALMQANKKRLQSMHRKAKSQGGQVHVSYKDAKTGKSATGRYGGMQQMGGRSYAKVHHKDRMTALPLHQVGDVKHVRD